MRRQPIILASFLALIAAVALLVEIARAADPPPPRPEQAQPDQFMYGSTNLDVYNSASAALRQSGVWRWYFERNPSCLGDIFPAIVAALDNISAEYAVYMVYDEQAGQRIYATCGVDFAAVCGGPPVIGCLGRGFPYNVDIDISIDMAAYFTISQIAISLHELHHGMATWNEQYQLGGTFAASQSVDIMNTGPLSRHRIQAVERERWARTQGPLSLRFYGMGRNAGGLYAFFCSPDAKATRVALLYADNGGPLYWSGLHVQTSPLDANGCRGQFVEERAGRCYYAKAETAVSWRVSPTEVLAGCS